MHESSLMNSLMKRVQELAVANQARKVVAIKVKLGALSHFSPTHFREHFEQAAQGSIAEGARLEIESLQDQDDPYAQDILLEEIEVEANG